MPELKEKDSILKLRNQLVSEYAVSEEEVVALEKNATEVVDEAYQFARESEYPKPEAALEDLYI